ncbi:MAG: V-type ATP synthase subunit K [Limnochordia bacterium]|jgi:V/A-type H+-transporting ATPase subunit K|nr:V-type ATP synthase subunit K [Bacillota bacterium]NLH31025.1 V-type ATP synthase subunit K [Bacillota bacterium]HOB08234.1 V-type ATP synthase subunit K [Limnochordia bacterium]HPZ30361.1 V-type ATP synthase subunit K [Limnochordia bacterium]HQD69829.1 V-type ATP synthase subunit K [Limnochordia bacterium]
MEFFSEQLVGTILAVIGAAFAFIIPGIGSSKAVGAAGQSAAGVLSEDPTKFVSVMVLEALPSTQAIYGFVIAFLIVGKIVVGEALDFGSGLILFLAGLPMGIVGYVSALWQGRVSISGINMVAKQGGGMIQGVILALMVEMFAILALIVSFQIIGKA